MQEPSVADNSGGSSGAAATTTAVGRRQNPRGAGAAGGGGSKRHSSSRHRRGRTHRLNRPRRERAREKGCEMLVSKLVDTDQPVPVLKAVLERGWTSAFLRSLDAYIRTKDAEIKSVCNFHYQEFTASCQEVLKMQRSAQAVKGQVRRLNTDLQQTGKKALTFTESLSETQRARKCMDDTLEAIDQARRLVDLSRRLTEQLQTRAFFSALSTLGTIETLFYDGVFGDALLRKHAHLRRAGGGAGSLYDESTEVDVAGGGLGFAERMALWIPQTMESIKEEVMESLTEWLVGIRGHTERIGETAIAQARRWRDTERCAERALRSKNTDSNSSSGASSSNSMVTPTKKNQRQSSTDSTTSEHSDPLGLLNELGVDLSPVKHFIQVFSHLGLRDAAVEYYRKNRLPQANVQTMVPVDTQTMSVAQFIQHHKALFYKILGFFYIEEALSAMFAADAATTAAAAAAAKTAADPAPSPAAMPAFSGVAEWNMVGSDRSVATAAVSAVPAGGRRGGTIATETNKDLESVLRREELQKIWSTTMGDLCGLLNRQFEPLTSQNPKSMLRVCDTVLLFCRAITGCSPAWCDTTTVSSMTSNAMAAAAMTGAKTTLESTAAAGTMGDTTVLATITPRRAYKNLYGVRGYRGRLGHTQLDPYPLVALLRASKPQFETVLSTQLRERLDSILQQENYDGLRVETEEELRRLVLDYGLARELSSGAERSGGSDINGGNSSNSSSSSIVNKDTGVVDDSSCNGKNTSSSNGSSGSSNGNEQSPSYPTVDPRTGPPWSFAFSWTVPRCLGELVRFIEEHYRFGQELDPPSTRQQRQKQHRLLMSTARMGKSADLLALLSPAAQSTCEAADRAALELNACMHTQAVEGDPGSVPVSLVMQISINAAAMARGLDHLDARVFALDNASQLGRTTTTNAHVIYNSTTSGGDESISRLFMAGRAFHATARLAQDRLMELVRHKIDDLLSSSCFVDWAPVEPSRAPHGYMSDVVDYLAVTFSCLARLPKEARDTLHFTSCTQVARALLNMLCGDNIDAGKGVTEINMYGIYNLSLDLQMLEGFAQGCVVLNLRECFSELRQMLQLLLSGQLEEHALDPVVRFELYPYISLEKLARVLAKYREPPPPRGLGLGLASSSARRHVKRLRKQTVDYVLTKLTRNLTNQNQQGAAALQGSTSQNKQQQQQTGRRQQQEAAKPRTGRFWGFRTKK